MIKESTPDQDTHAAPGDSPPRGESERSEDRAEQPESPDQHVVVDLRETARDEAQQRMSGLADRLEAVEQAIDSAAHGLDEEGEDRLSAATEKAAAQVNGATDYLRERDAGSVLSDVEEMGRTRPAIFLGTTFAAGLALGRFLRASRP